MTLVCFAPSQNGTARVIILVCSEIPTEREGILMRSTKHSMSALALGLAFALTGTMAAQSGKAALDGAIGMLNPCNNAIVVVPGSTDVNFHQNGNHVTVHVQFHNNGQDLQTQ